jgi:CRP/FNR family transcriptional regulator
MLSDLRKKDAIEYEGGLIVIKDISQLQEICHCEMCPASVCRI